jgi:alkanesulfonate monooxygenase SsuD/methylene tetrahydromethanopterin reductase-like flavin-dependent oxidoreductase (luciferase family)
MRLSMYIPTHIEGAPDFRELPARARAIEDAGFAGIYLVDHILPVKGVHTSAFLETVVALTMLASCTERVTIGSGSMVVGFRHPVLLAKQLASIAVLAGPRLVLVASSGWFDREYAAFGYRIDERGARTDETLAATRELLTSERVSYKGRFWSFSDVTIEPRPAWPVPFVIAGGSRTPDAGSEHDRPYMAPTVLRRIALWDGWLAPCAGNQALTVSDLQLVRAELRAARERAGFRMMHVQWIHMVDTDDRDRALMEQLPKFRAMMGPHHTDQHFIDTYLVGSRIDIKRRVMQLRDLGFDELILSPVTHDRGQIELIADLLKPSAESIEVAELSS